jgi:hypothetical protein
MACGLLDGVMDVVRKESDDFSRLLAPAENLALLSLGATLPPMRVAAQPAAVLPQL